MAKQKTKSAPLKKNHFPWPVIAVLGVILVAVGVFIYLETPAEQELDLAVIEQGENVVVQIHDPL